MIRRVKGTRDILPPDSLLWQKVEAIANEIFSGFGYDEIRLPALEPTELFVRSVGEGTDIVAKEMYTFEDRKGRSLTLRPEGTASVARAFIENGLGQRPQPVRLSYIGPMWRYERMQRGRYRQFAQIGIEILGAYSPTADVEVLLALHTFLAALGFDDLVIALNNLGDPEDRVRFITELKNELAVHKDELCGDCQRRWDTNPLRILDCKVARCGELVAETSPITAFVSEDAKQHVDRVTESLETLGITVERNPRLVRGLDYYLRTVFEIISPELGKNTVICGGGRYDRLISDLGGKAVPGIGFAIGEDRLIDVLPQSFKESVLDRKIVAILPLGDTAVAAGLGLARVLIHRGFKCRTEVTGRSLKAGLKWAQKNKASVVIILGEQEMQQGEAIVRDLERGQQESVKLENLNARISEIMTGTETV